MDRIGAEAGGDSRLERRRRALVFSAVLCLALALPFAILALAPLAPAVSPQWDGANILGYLALATSLLLFVYAGRPRAFPPFSGRFFANLHRDLGYLALLLTAGHVGVLLLAEPLLLEHLKPTAPLYMLAGLAASVVLLILVVSSLTRLRRRVWPDYHRFKRVHYWLAIGYLACVGWHLAGSYFYLNSVLKLACLGIASAAVVGLHLRRRLVRRARSGPGDRLRQTAGYSHWVSVASVLLVLAAVMGLAALRFVE